MVRGRSLSRERCQISECIATLPPLQRSLSTCDGASEKIWERLHGRTEFEVELLQERCPPQLLRRLSAASCVDVADVMFSMSDGEDSDGHVQAEHRHVEQKGGSLEQTRRYMRPQRVSRKRMTREVSPRLLQSRWLCGRKQGKGTAQSSEPVEAPFQRLQSDFEKRYQQELHFAFGPEAKISHAEVSPQLKRMFLDSMRRSPEAAVRLGYHGTAQKNYGSILKQGLRVPGNGGVRIVNGAAHGVGIYTARLGCAGLSQGFACGGRSMLVCGVLDEPDENSMGLRAAKKLDEPRRLLKCGREPKCRHMPAQRAQPQPASAAPSMLGRFQVHKRTKHVLHVGQAQVIFNEQYVVPLLRVDHTPNQLYRASWHESSPSVEEPVAAGEEPKEELPSTKEQLPQQELRLRRHLRKVYRQRQRRAQRSAKHSSLL